MSCNLCVEIALHNSENWFVWGRFEGKVRNVIHYFFFSITIAYHIILSYHIQYISDSMSTVVGTETPSSQQNKSALNSFYTDRYGKFISTLRKKGKKWLQTSTRPTITDKGLKPEIYSRAREKKNLVYGQGGKKVTPVSTILLLFCCRCCHKCKWKDIFGFGYTYKRRKQRWNDYSGV